MLLSPESNREGVVVVRSQVHRQMSSAGHSRRQGDVASVWTVYRVCLADAATISQRLSVQRTLPTDTARSRVLVSVWNVYWQLWERQGWSQVDTLGTQLWMMIEIVSWEYILLKIMHSCRLDSDTDTWANDFIVLSDWVSELTRSGAIWRDTLQISTIHSTQRSQNWRCRFLFQSHIRKLSSTLTNSLKRRFSKIVDFTMCPSTLYLHLCCHTCGR